MEKSDKGFNWKISYSLAILSGVLLLLSYPPLRFGGFLAWIALVPLFIAIYYESKAKRVGKLAEVACLGLLLFLAFAIPTAQEYLLAFAKLNVPWLAFIVGIVLAIGLAGMYVEGMIEYWKPKRLPSRLLSYFLEKHPGVQVLVLPIAWIAFEFLLMNVPGVMRIGGVLGFISIAKTQWLNPPILQLASFTGIYGVTFLILLVNCSIACAIVHYRETKRIFKRAAAVLPVFVLILVFGVVSVPGRAEGDVNIAIIQTPLPLVEEENLDDTYRSLTQESLKYEPRVVMWPFSPVANFFVEPSADFGREHNIYLADGTTLIYSDGEIEHHNFGYHIKSLPEQIKSGDIYHVFFPEIYGFDSELGKFGTVVCFESAPTLPANDLARQGVEFLIVASGGPNHYLFSWGLGSNAIFRAAEHRMYAVSILGDRDSSIIIDPYGRIIEDIAPEEEIVAGRVAFTEERTFYTKYGDIFGWTIFGLFIGMISYNLYLKRKSTYTFCKQCRSQMEKGTEVCPACGKKVK